MSSGTKAHILLAEDDPNLGSLLKDYLEAKDYRVHLAENGKDAFRAFNSEAFNICILDVMMPVMDGFTLAKEIRKTNAEIPLVFLTARALREDAIEGFRAGADDYVTKPFSMEELLLRIEAILRRSGGNPNKEEQETQFEIGNFTFDSDTHQLSLKGQSKKLTTRESDLLKLLCLHRTEGLDRNYALKKLWNDYSYFNARSMDVYITKLRKYLKDDPRVEILNIHGKGFRLLVNKNL